MFLILPQYVKIHLYVTITTIFNTKQKYLKVMLIVIVFVYKLHAICATNNPQTLCVFTGINK